MADRTEPAPLDAHTDLGALAQRPEDDDYDLLTYGEAGARLAEEIARARQALSEAPAADVPLIEERVAALERAVVRNSRRPVNDENFERFFGYPAPPRSGA